MIRPYPWPSRKSGKCEENRNICDFFLFIYDHPTGLGMSKIYFFVQCRENLGSLGNSEIHICAKTRFWLLVSETILFTENC